MIHPIRPQPHRPQSGRPQPGRHSADRHFAGRHFAGRQPAGPCTPVNLGTARTPDPNGDCSPKDRPSPDVQFGPKVGPNAGSGPAGGRAPSGSRAVGGVVVRALGAVVLSGLLIAATAGPAAAAPPASLDEVISRITTWLVRLAAGLATLFLTYGAVRLLTAGGDPGAAEKAKAAIRGAGYGYLLALLAPLIVAVLSSFVS